MGAGTAGITAGVTPRSGSASASSAQKQYVEQLVVVTDEGENADNPRFWHPRLLKYEELKADPAVCFVKVTGATTQLEDEVQEVAGITADAYQFNGDYYALAEPGSAARPPEQARTVPEDPGVPAAGGGGWVIVAERPA